MHILFAQAEVWSDHRAYGRWLPFPKRLQARASTYRIAVFNKDGQDYRTVGNTGSVRSYPQDGRTGRLGTLIINFSPNSVKEAISNYESSHAGR